MTLAYLLKGETFEQLGAGFGARPRPRGATSTRPSRCCRPARRSWTERWPRRRRTGWPAYLVLDGTLIAIDRVKADRPFYSGKHRKHGVNLQVIAGPDGRLVRVSGALPGSTHDLNAARIWGIIRELAKTGLIVLTGQGLPGRGPAHPHSVQGQEQARAQEAGQPLPRPPPRPRRAGERPAQDLEDPHETTLLPTPRRPPRQSDPRPSRARDHRLLKKAPCIKDWAGRSGNHFPYLPTMSGGLMVSQRTARAAAVTSRHGPTH